MRVSLEHSVPQKTDKYLIACDYKKKPHLFLPLEFKL